MKKIQKVVVESVQCQYLPIILPRGKLGLSHFIFANQLIAQTLQEPPYFMTENNGNAILFVFLLLTNLKNQANSQFHQFYITLPF